MIYNIHLTTPLPTTFRTAQVAGLFDLPPDELESRLAHTLTAELPGLDEVWTIGAIVGPSGSGKTTLARAAYGDAVHDPPPWPDDLPVIEAIEMRNAEFGMRNGNQMRSAEFGMWNEGSDPSSTPHSAFCIPNLKLLLRTLTAVGLASPPSWLKPYRVLSTGERFRADLARAMIQMRNAEFGVRNEGNCPTLHSEFRTPHLLVFDEFTSALDRTTACTASFALAKLLRSLASNPQLENRNPKFIALSCHTDFLPWLAPDWILDLADAQSQMTNDKGPMTPHWPRGSLQRPALRLAVRRVPQALWPRFAGHHYLTGGLSTAATCYAAFAEMRNAEFGMQNEGNCPQTPHSAFPIPHSTPIAFCAALATLGWKRTKHISRLVVLPEFQGLGVGPRLAEAVAEHQSALGHRVTITASHPAIVVWCWRSPRWRFTGLKKTGSTRQRLGQRTIRCSTGRAVASFEYVPQ
jgi:GNAT superfamily N-acetyltransferase